MLPRAKKEEGSDGDGSEGITTKETVRYEKVIFAVEGVSLHYMREDRNMMTSILSSENHQINVFKRLCTSGTNHCRMPMCYLM